MQRKVQRPGQRGQWLHAHGVLQCAEFMARSQQALQRLRAEDRHAGLAVLQHVAHALVGVAGVDRDIGRAGFPHRQHGREEVQPTRHHDGHELARRDAQADEQRGQALGTLVEFGVAQALRAMHGAEGLRCARDLGLDQRGQGLVDGEMQSRPTTQVEQARHIGGAGLHDIHHRRQNRLHPRHRIRHAGIP